MKNTPFFAILSSLNDIKVLHENDTILHGLVENCEGFISEI
jgi:hypothetical protein